MVLFCKPRVCGEKLDGKGSSKRLLGSPPRMRGKAAGHRLGLILNRITPAYAGKRKSCAAQKTSAWDHPRMCGEKFDNPKIDNSQLGSPPHVRGKEAHNAGDGAVHRITPACAGKRGSGSG